MDAEEVSTYCLSKPEARIDYPFDAVTAVFKVKGKMFALLSPSSENRAARLNLKCEPMQALELRDLFESITAGYHMNKKHWNSLWLDQSIPLGEIERQIDHSYRLVFQSLKASERKAMQLSYDPHALFGDEA